MSFYPDGTVTGEVHASTNGAAAGAVPMKGDNGGYDEYQRGTFDHQYDTGGYWDGYSGSYSSTWGIEVVIGMPMGNGSGHPVVGYGENRSTLGSGTT